MKQKIQLTSKNISDLFKLPCVVRIQKRIVMGKHGDYIPSQNFDDCIIAVVHKPQECLVGTRALVGDWLVEDDNGNWYVEEGDKQ